MVALIRSTKARHPSVALYLPEKLTIVGLQGIPLPHIIDPTQFALKALPSSSPGSEVFFSQRNTLTPPHVL